jgi:2,3-dihydroxybenzoate decarboxylase
MSARADYKRIATEEAWAPADLLKRYQQMAADRAIADPGFIALWTRLGARGQLVERLADIGDRRIGDMNASGIDVQILSLTSPGVQVFDAATANAIATDTNDQVA